MRKNLLMLLVLGMVVAMSAQAMAASWTGAAGDGDFANFANWSAPPTNAYVTEIADLRAAATLSAGDLAWDRLQMKGGTLDVTGGSAWFRNYTSTNGIVLFRGSTMNISGGKIIGEQVNVGDDLYDFSIADNPAGDGVNFVNISGTGMLKIQPNDFPDPPLGGTVAFRIWPNGSAVTIADNGILKVHNSLSSDVSTYLADGRIAPANAGDVLGTSIDGDYVIVSIVPEPGTLLLLCLGLGSLALIRRK
jgi:hypothetical protein